MSEITITVAIERVPGLLVPLEQAASSCVVAYAHRDGENMVLRFVLDTGEISEQAATDLGRLLGEAIQTLRIETGVGAPAG